MAIPAIAPYRLPGDLDLPRNRVAWKPDSRRSVLLIHDMQRYFLAAFAAEDSPMVELLTHIKSIRQRCVELGIPVVYTAQPGGQSPKQRGLLRDFWGAGIGADAEQPRIMEDLAPGDRDIVVTKWRYSAFQRTDLLDILRQLGRDQLIICGVYAHIGCLMTACEAFMQDIQPFFIADAVADFSLEYHTMAISYAAQRCAFTLSTQQLLAHLRPSPDRPATAAELSAESFTIQRLREDIAAILAQPVSAIADDDNLLYTGLDSIRLMSLLERWRREGVELGFVELAERPTIAGWWELIAARTCHSATNPKHPD